MIDRVRNAPVAWTVSTNSASQRGPQTPFSALITDAPSASPGIAASSDQSEHAGANCALLTPPSNPPRSALIRNGAHAWGEPVEPVPAKADRSIRSRIEGLEAQRIRPASDEPGQPPVALGGEVASQINVPLPSSLEQGRYQVPEQPSVATGDDGPRARTALVDTELRAAGGSHSTPPSNLQRLQHFMELDRARPIERATHAPMPLPEPPARGDEWPKEAVVRFQTPAPMRVSQTESDVMSLEIKEPGRSVETVNVPWRLLAHMTLSQQGRLGTLVSTLDERPTLGVERGSPSAMPGKNISTRATSQTLPALDSEDPALPGAAPISFKAARSDTRVGVHATEQSALYMNAAATPWAQRLVRWSSDQAVDSALWLRDYTIGEEAAAELLRSLQAFAKANGVHVTRMMFNGQELWRAPTPEARRERYGD
jgi:hypothetical protein